MKTNDFAFEANENDVLTMNDYEILLNCVWRDNDLEFVVDMFLNSLPETKDKTTEEEAAFYYEHQILGSFYRRIIGETEFKIQYLNFITERINFSIQ